MIDVLLQNTSPRRSQSTPVTVTTFPSTKLFSFILFRGILGRLTIAFEKSIKGVVKK